MSERKKMEKRVALSVDGILRGGHSDEETVPGASLELCSLLERYLPLLLARHHREWRGESLDGVFVARIRRASTSVLEVLGTCILISDQSLAPFFASLGLSSSRDVISSYNVLLGEPGGGHLGISGPPCDSKQAATLKYSVIMRFDAGGIDWVYKIWGP